VTGLARSVLGITVALVMSSGPGAAAASPLAVEYLYINASEGSAAGGHAALRFGDQVFHFEHRPPGILVLARDGFEHFRHLYGDLENRTIRASRIPVNEETYTLLLGEFSRRHAVQRQRLETLEGFRGDRALLEALQGPTPASVAGLGLFAEAPEPAATPRVEPALVSLRGRVVERYGDELVPARMRELTDRLAALEPDADAPAPAGAGDDELRPPAYRFSERFRDTAQALAALQVLDSARPLRTESIVPAPATALPLGSGEAEGVARLADALEDSLARLLDSARPDWGLPMLVGMARLSALRQTVSTGRWVILDAFPADATMLDPPRGSLRRERLSRIREANRLALDAARTALLEAASSPAPFPEAAYARFEAAANRWLEVGRALDERRPLRVHRGVLLPSPAGPLAGTPSYEPARLARALDAARGGEADALAALERDYAYNLVTRNCVSEIFREVDAAFARAAGTDDAIRVREESVRRLGGHVDLAGSLAFIPRVSALVVEDTYAVAERQRLDSFRRRALALMRRDENPVWVFLRESNVLTSTLYRPHPRDSIFLFFTDDTVGPRPLFGALNLVTGLGASVVGLAMLPVDGGETLWAGLRGAVFSLPELVFQNIRKGSFDAP